MHQIQTDWMVVLGLFIFQIGFQIGRIYQRKVSSSRWEYSPSQNNCFDTQETMLSVGSDQQQQIQTQLKLEWIEQKQQGRQAKKKFFVQQSSLFDIVSVNKNNIFNELEPNQKNQLIAIQSQVLSNSRKVELFQPLKENIIHQILQTHLNLPLVQHKYIDITDKTVPQQYSRIFCQTGRFKKLFFNHQMIGAGGFGQVFSAKSRIEDKNFAIKKLFISNYKNKIELMKEVRIISSFYHENIVRFFTCWIEEADFTEEISQYQEWLKAQDSKKSRYQSSEKLQIVQHISSSNSDIQFVRSQQQQSLSEKSRKSLSNKKNQLAIVARPQNSNKPFLTLFIQMELCGGGTLYNYLKNRTQICPKFAFKIFQQLLNGVNYLHQLGVVHRDLKPANILIDDKRNQIKIGDFGLAVFFNTQQQNTGYLSEDKQNKFRKVGTPCYIAPQLLHGLPLRDLRQADIYSLGVIYYEMLNDFTTHHERGQKLNKLKENQVIGLQNMKLERRLIKLLTKRNRPLVNDIIMKKQFTQLKKKYQNEVL